MSPWRAHTIRVRAAAALTWLATAFIFTLLVAAVAPLALGLHTYTVRSGSMEPTISTGDIVIAEQISPREAGVGDIVTFKDPEGSGVLVTHRVRAIRPQGGRLAFVTRGDANNSFERWSVGADGSIGRVSYRVPLLGYALAPLDGVLGRLGLIVIPALALCGLGLIRIWAPERFDEGETEVS